MHAHVVELLEIHNISMALHPADAAMPLSTLCTWSMSIVYMLLHLHHLQDIEVLHLSFSVCNHSANKQHSLVWGYSHLQNAQTVHQHHTRHVAIQ